MFAFRRLASQVASNVRAAHQLPDLPYAYEALEPIISRDIMCYHHSKHHQAYVNNLNIAEEKAKAALEKGDFGTVISLANTLRFNGGGHINHSIFWQNLSPCDSKPSNDLCQAFIDCFGGIDKFKEGLSQAAIAVMGSGWGWLGYDPKSGCLKIVSCPNQDPLEPTTGLVPLLGIDVWEHAYYLQYQNRRADYVQAIWDIVNWKDVNERYGKVSGNPCV